MTKTTSTLQDIRCARALAQHQLGVQQGYASQIETGKRLPGPQALNKIVAALNAADPTHPVTPVEVMTACRASRAASVARAPSAGVFSVIGSASSSCPHPTRIPAPKRGRSARRASASLGGAK